MKRETARYLALLEKRLSAMHQLAQGIKDSSVVLAEVDLDGIHQHTAHQENLCTEIRFLNGELDVALETLASAFGLDRAHINVNELVDRIEAEAAQRLRILLNELTVAEAKVRRLNRIHASLLQRSRRSVNVMMNFMANYSATYQLPKAGAAAPSPTLVRA